ncbi:sulfite exporter TauE/SafE family protein [Clostridium cochlearium]|uniref:sulfite exporter TauE/SafE family protein n=1 Tax=Clostridium cochlearium TaxID=1494 RepID=UPI0016742C9F|nr:sulfite exporter TauE/SafE family protein [Clostridium cochlearium]
MGILGSTAPCQITTNLGAIGYLSRESTNKRKIIINTIWYITGKLLVFLSYGLLILVFNINIQQASIPLFEFMRKLTGPLVILIGLYILGLVKLKASIGISLSSKIESYINKQGKFNSSFLLGIIFSLAFCPTLFWLFFGLTIPISIKAPMGFLFPIIFALGTLVPMLMIIFLLSLGKTNINSSIKLLRKFQKSLRPLGGLALTIIGFIDTLIYWF